jgi:hypothetical protein
MAKYQEDSIMIRILILAALLMFAPTCLSGTAETAWAGNSSCGSRC